MVRSNPPTGTSPRRKEDEIRLQSIEPRRPGILLRARPRRPTASRSTNPTAEALADRLAPGPEELGYLLELATTVSDGPLESSSGVEAIPIEQRERALGRLSSASWSARPLLRSTHRPAHRRADGGLRGQAIGIDMTPQMLERAAQSARRDGPPPNVELHLALIESLPLEDESVDVVISNGVIDLCRTRTRSSTRSTASCAPVGAADRRRRSRPRSRGRATRIDLWTG